MQSCSSAPSVLILLLIIFITGSESAVPVVKVKYGGTAVLPCIERCSGVVSWTPSDKSTDILAECDKTSCRSVKEGYQMIYNQYLQGDLSLNITEADFSKRGRYTCDCDGTDKCDVVLQIEALKTPVLIKSGDSLLMKLDGSVSVEVIYNSTRSVDGSRDQICTVIGGSMQCEPEYKHRTSLSSSSVLELRDMEESDSGVYTIRDTKNKEDIHIYSVTVTVLEILVQKKSGDSLQLELEVSDPVEVIYNSRGAADGSSVQICTVIGGSLQCKPEYKNRTSLLSSSALELREIKESDRGVYTIRTIGNKEDIHIYTVTVRDPNIPAWTIVFIVLGVGVGLVVLVLVVVLLCKWREIRKKNQKESKRKNQEIQDLKKTLILEKAVNKVQLVQYQEQKNKTQEEKNPSPTKSCIQI